ncbi:MAG: hypothetical protein QNJ68_17425 [Microcoleaceae cyanobacterium MO_207.B10]|nr:hypothetical protein [Microcoleaceae cyanobacterium MO_207.B10]
MDIWQPDSDYPNFVPLESHIKFEVQLERNVQLHLDDNFLTIKLLQVFHVN